MSLVKEDTITNDDEAALTASEGDDVTVDVNDEIVDDIEDKADDLVADAEELKTEVEEVLHRRLSQFIQLTASSIFSLNPWPYICWLSKNINKKTN